MMFLDIIWDIRGALRSLIASITELVYKLIAGLYNLFIALSQISLFKNNEVETIYKRVEVILAVIMVFYVSFQFIKYIVNPETFSDKEKGAPGLIKKMVIVVFLMGFGTSIFATADKIRNTIITKQVLPQLIFQDSANNNYSQDTAGYNFSSQMIRLFYTANPDVKDEKCDDNHTAAQTVELQLSNFANGNDLQLSFCAGKYVKKDAFLFIGGDLHWLVNLEWLYAILVGGFIAWVLINYCVEAAKIVFQLALLEVIAPIPIISYLSPDKDGMFQKWGKQVLTTYLDLIVRLFIIYLMMYFCDLALKAFNNINSIIGNSVSGDFMQMLVKIFLIIGLLYFAMQAPKLIKELLPKGMAGLSGNFGFGAKSAKERFNPSARLAGAGLGKARALGAAGRRAAKKAKANIDKYGNPLTRQGRQNRKNAKIVASAEKRAARQQYKADRRAAKEELEAARTAYGDELARQAKAIKDGKKVTKPEFTETDKNNLENKRSRLKELDKAAASGTLSEADRRERMALRKEVGDLEVKQIMASAEGGVALSSAALNALKVKNDANVRLQDANQKIAAAQAILDSHTATPEQKDKAQNDKNVAQAAKAQAEKDISNADSELNKSKNVSGYVSAIEGVKNSKQELASSRTALEAQKENYTKVMSDPKATPADKEAAEAALKKCQEDVATKESALAKSQENLEKASEPFKTTVKGTTLTKNDMENISESVKTSRANVDAAQAKTYEAKEKYNKTLHEALDTWSGNAATTFAKTVVTEMPKDVVHGFKTKEINKVIPNFVNDIKQDVQTEAKRAEWIAQGGNDTFVGNINRTVDNIGSKYFGVTPESKTIANSIKPLEIQVESYKKISGVNDKAISAFGSAEKAIADARQGAHFSASLDPSDEFYQNILGFKHPKTGAVLGNLITDNMKGKIKDTRGLVQYLSDLATNAEKEYEAFAALKNGDPDYIADDKARVDRLNELARLKSEANDNAKKFTKQIDRATASLWFSSPDKVFFDDASTKAALSSMRESVLASISNNTTYEMMLECISQAFPSIQDQSDMRKVLEKLRSGSFDGIKMEQFNKLNDWLIQANNTGLQQVITSKGQQIEAMKDVIKDVQLQEERPGGSSSGDSGKK